MDDEEVITEEDAHRASHVFLTEMIAALWDAIDLLANELGVDIGSQLGAGMEETEDTDEEED